MKRKRLRRKASHKKMKRMNASYDKLQQIKEWHYSNAQRTYPETAVKADCSQQNHSWCGRNCYMDADYCCRDCNKVFTFSVQEQRFWYEEIKIYIDTYPTRCTDCRWKKRRIQMQRAIYDANINEAFEQRAPKLMQQVLDAIIEMEKAQKLPRVISERKSFFDRQLKRLKAVVTC